MTCRLHTLECNGNMKRSRLNYGDNAIIIVKSFALLVYLLEGRQWNITPLSYPYKTVQTLGVRSLANARMELDSFKRGK